MITWRSNETKDFLGLQNNSTTSRTKGQNMDDRQITYDLGSIREELEAWVAAATSPNENRRQAMERELEIWAAVCEAQAEGRSLPTDGSLNLEGLGLQALSPTLCRLPAEAVGELNLSRNNLRALPPAIGALTGLGDLALNHNELESLPPEIGALTGLVRLAVSGNRLRTLPPAIGALTRLINLEADHNRLAELTPAIGALTELTELHLDHNELSALPSEICPSRRLMFLRLHNNQLTTLPRTLVRLRVHAQVDARGNPITSLPENIGRWKRFLLEISGGNLPERVLTALQNLNSGPHIRYDMTQAGQAQTVEQDRQLSRPLEEAVASWIPESHPGKGELLNRFQAIREQYESTEMANRMREFSRLLDRLREMADYRNETTRPTVDAQVTAVLRMALTDKTGRDKLFETAQTALGTCGDRVAEGWSEMLRALDSRIAIRDDWPLDKRLECIRGEWLNQHIELETYELCNRENIRFTDPVEVAIGFKRRLANEFGLPHVMKDMLYPACAAITDAGLQEMREHLQGLDRHLFVDYVADHPLWEETMKQRQEGALALIDESFERLLNEDAAEVKDFAPGQKFASPVIQALYAHTPHDVEWAKALKEIAEARQYARRLIYVEQAEAALPLTTVRRETTAQEASSSSSRAAPPFNPPSEPLDDQAAARRTARLVCLEEFALEQVVKAGLFNYENLTRTLLTPDDYEQIKRATGAANPNHTWAKLDQDYNRAAPVGRLTNEDRTFIFVADSATPDSPNVRVILAPAAALREREAELDAIIAENSLKPAKDRIKVSFNCESGAERRGRKRSRSLMS
jgi:Leucine-rich repeat (LRR) protein